MLAGGGGQQLFGGSRLADDMAGGGCSKSCLGLVCLRDCNILGVGSHLQFKSYQDSTSDNVFQPPNPGPKVSVTLPSRACLKQRLRQQQQPLLRCAISQGKREPEQHALLCVLVLEAALPRNTAHHSPAPGVLCPAAAVGRPMRHAHHCCHLHNETQNLVRAAATQQKTDQRQPLHAACTDLTSTISSSSKVPLVVVCSKGHSAYQVRPPLPCCCTR